MFDIQSLVNEIQRLTDSVAWWNKWVIAGMAATAIAACFLVFVQLMVNRESKLLAESQDKYIKFRDERLAEELIDKGVLIAEANERAAKAEVRAAEANQIAEKSRQDNAKHEHELVEQRQLLAEAGERVAKAETQASEAKLDLEKFKAPRTVSFDQEAILVKELTPYRDEKMRIELYSGNEEIERFAYQISNAFKKAGIVVDIRPILKFGGAKSGLSATMGSERKRFTEAVASALIASKLITAPLPVSESREASEFALVIGHK